MLNPRRLLTASLATVMIALLTINSATACRWLRKRNKCKPAPAYVVATVPMQKQMPAQKGDMMMTELPADEPAETPAEKPAETPAEKPAETPAEKPAETPAEKPAEKPPATPPATPATPPATPATPPATPATPPATPATPPATPATPPATPATPPATPATPPATPATPPATPATPPATPATPPATPATPPATPATPPATPATPPATPATPPATPATPNGEAASAPDFSDLFIGLPSEKVEPAEQSEPAAEASDPFGAIPTTRQWVDNTGLYKVQALLVEIQSGKVRLLKANGRTTTVELRRLSEGDQSYVAEMAASHGNGQLVTLAVR